MRGFFESEVGSASLPDTRVRNADGAATRSADGTVLGLADAVEPDWAGAAVWETDLIVVTEVPAKLKRSVDYTVLVEKSGSRVSLITQEPNVRVLMVEPRDGGETYCMLATFLPDEGWGVDAGKLAVGGKAGDYSGLVVYSLPDGTSAWGWRYDGGEATHIVLFDDGAAELQDPDLSISMGSSVETLTRANDNYIEAVTCIGYAPKKNASPERVLFYGPLNDDSGYYFAMLGWRGMPRDGRGSAPTPIDPVVVRAKKIFKSTTLTPTQWQRLENMLNKITFDCMGNNLYNAILKSGKQYDFSFFFGTDKSNYNGSTIFLRESVATDITLFHEMFHAHQHSKEINNSAFNGAQVNMEIEAKVAEIRYVTTFPNYINENMGKYNTSDMRIFSLLESTLLFLGKDMYGNFLEDFNNAYIEARGIVEKDYKRDGKYPLFDNSRSIEDNFKNLAELNKGC